MSIITATTADVEKAMNIVLAKAKYTAEFNAPCINLIEHFKLSKGEKQLTIPKSGQMTATDLVDGEDMTDTQDLGLTFTDLTTAEVGLKVILTYKTIHQFNEDVFTMIGRQMGDAMARKKNRDIIALFSGLNGGTVLGADDQYLTLSNASNVVSRSRSGKYSNPISFVHHPNAIFYLCKAAAAIGATYYAGILGDLSEELLRNFWRINIGGVNFFETGDIDKISGYDSGYGAIISKSALAYLEEQGFTKEQDKDISLRAYEVVVTADYGCWEIDDSMGAPVQYEIGDLATST